MNLPRSPSWLSMIVVVIGGFTGCKPDAKRAESTTEQVTERATQLTPSGSNGELAAGPLQSTSPESPMQEVPLSDSAEEFVSGPLFSLGGPANGIEFTRYDDFTTQHRIAESTGGGCAVLDFDCDGWPDVLMLDGCKLVADVTASHPTCALFRNYGARQFGLVTSGSSLFPTSYLQGVSVGDYDSDGFPDIYFTAIGKSGMWRNNGDGTFTNVTSETGVEVNGWSTSCAFADLNSDGHLDLYVVNYLQDSISSPRLCPNPLAPGGHEQCPPSKYEGLNDVLFVSQGDGRFVDQTEAAGMGGLKGKGLGVVISDFDRDQTPEIFVANDGQANFLFVAKSAQGSENGNAGADLRYDQRGMIAGCALSRSGYAQASMGVAAGDFDGNGTIDLFLTHFYGDSNTTYLNRAKLRFEDATRASGMAGVSRRVLGWGTVATDFDHDGWLDLMVANGHVEDRRWMGKGEPYAMEPHLFVNSGKGNFRDATKTAGEYFSQARLGRGVATGDLDRDGRMDFVVNHLQSASSVLWNETKVQRQGVQLKLQGIRSNRDGIGCKIELLDEQETVVGYRELVGGGSFQSSSLPEVHFTLDENKKTYFRVLWPSGVVDSVRMGGVSSALVVEERGIIPL